MFARPTSDGLMRIHMQTTKQAHDGCDSISLDSPSSANCHRKEPTPCQRFSLMEYTDKRVLWSLAVTALQCVFFSFLLVCSGYQWCYRITPDVTYFKKFLQMVRGADPLCRIIPNVRAQRVLPPPPSSSSNLARVTHFVRNLEEAPGDGE